MVQLLLSARENLCIIQRYLAVLYGRGVCIDAETIELDFTCIDLEIGTDGDYMPQTRVPVYQYRMDCMCRDMGIMLSNNIHCIAERFAIVTIFNRYHFNW